MNNYPSTEYDRDVLYHIKEVVQYCESLQLKFNREPAIFRYAQNILESAKKIEKLYEFSSSSKLIEIGRCVNNLYNTDSNLSIVILTVYNSKRICNPDAIASLKFSI